MMCWEITYLYAQVISAILSTGIPFYRYIMIYSIH